MKKIKLKFTGGGLDGFSKFNKPEETKKDKEKVPVNPALASYQKSVETDRKFRLLNENALRGILFFLAGEQKRVSALNSTDVESAIKSRKCIITRQPFFEMFATRYKNSKNDPKKWRNGGCTLRDAKPIMSLFEEEISQVFGTSHLDTIREKIYKKGKPSFTLNLIEQIDNLLNVISCMSPDISSTKFIKTTNRRLMDAKEIIKISLQNPDFLKEKQNKPIKDAYLDENVLKAYSNIFTSLEIDKVKREKIKKIKTETTPLPIREKWLASPPALTTDVGYLLKADFNVYLDVSDELFEKLIKGPGTAHWAHHGLVEWSDVKDKDMPEENELDDEVYYNIPYTDKERKEMAKKEKIKNCTA